ncbi:MAG: molybdopterin-guanine dinucleotide biosynthesis protein B [Desulfobacterales bacterium]|nr:molybdopterin-guanine dinucleotide biosynthesis protein B [Desulfobacterales bacterium]
MPSLITVVGKSDSGKTTLMEKLIRELKKRGYRIGTIKHAFHVHELDQKDKDSWRHKAAGADTVLVATEGKIAMVKDVARLLLDDLEKYFDDMDLILTEGFKQENRPKIEVFRKDIHQAPLFSKDGNLIAMVTDADLDLAVPTFGLEEIEPLVDLIEKKFL